MRNDKSESLLYDRYKRPTPKVEAAKEPPEALSPTQQAFIERYFASKGIEGEPTFKQFRGALRALIKYCQQKGIKPPT